MGGTNLRTCASLSLNLTASPGGGWSLSFLIMSLIYAPAVAQISKDSNR